jgi:dolichol-phosphate mannosyltransferase
MAEKNSKVIFYLIPVYNEEENISELCKNLSALNLGYTNFFVFVDDKSTDNTIESIKKNCKENYTVLTKEKNIGPGDSFNLGFEWILNNFKTKEDRIVTLEGDNTSDLNILSQMISISQIGFDLVLASVYAQGGGIKKTNLWRYFLSLIGNLVVRFIINLKVQTLSSFFRVYTLDILLNLKKQFEIIIEEKGYISMVEVLYKSSLINAKIIEVPMILDPSKRKGSSKMKVFKTIIDYIKFLINAKKRFPINV